MRRCDQLRGWARHADHHECMRLEDRSVFTPRIVYAHWQIVVIQIAEGERGASAVGRLRIRKKDRRQRVRIRDRGYTTTCAVG